jgi:hypothetical protein
MPGGNAIPCANADAENAAANINVKMVLFMEFFLSLILLELPV